MSKISNNIICRLIKDGYVLCNTDLNGKFRKPKLFLTLFQWGLFLLAILFSSLKNWLCSDWISIVLTTLSILFGFGLNIVILFYDKYTLLNKITQGLNDEEKTKLIQLRNFYKKFISISFYSFALVFICLGIFGFLFSVQLEKLDLNNFNFGDMYTFKISINEFILILQSLGIWILKTVGIFALFEYLRISLISLESLHQFITLETKNKIK